jgi:hypothetical protein
MLKLLPIFLLACQLFRIGIAIAHPGHAQVLNERLAILRGKAIVSSLIRKEEPVKGEVLDETWQQVTDSATCKETPEYYLIAFDNRQLGKTLYILLTSAGVACFEFIR